MDGRKFKSIKCKEQVFDVAFHPQHDLLAAGIIDGSIELWHHNRGIDTTDSSNSTTKHSLKQKVHHHQGSCRGLEFTSTGDKLYSISADKSWQVIDANGKLICTKSNAHSSAINKLKLLNDHFFSTGDDQGIVKVWDNRQPTSSNEVMSWDAHTDFIADFDFSEENHTLFSVSGDATLGVYDIRNQKHFYRSDDQESELHCVRIIKNEKKVICGSQDGVMLSFNWGQWGDCSDRFPGHPETVDCMWKVDENTIVTGSSDGFIRVLSVMPNKILGVVGDHKGYPVENIRSNYDNQILASIAHDEKIRLWDVSMLQDDEDDRADDDEQEEEEEEEEEDDGDDSADNNVEGEGNENEDEECQEGSEDEDEDEIEEDSDVEDSDVDKSDDDSSDSSNDDSEGSDSDSRDSDTEEKSIEVVKASTCSNAKVPSKKSESIKVNTAKSKTKKNVDGKPTKTKGNEKPNQKKKKKNQQQSDPESEDSDDDSDDSDEDDGPANKRKKLPTAREMFYSDL